MTAFSDSILITGEESKTVKRIAMGQDGFNEQQLQTLIFKHPEALPFKELAPHLQEPVPICMELNTPAGSADILYATPSGQVVLVEVKLWNNHEARRTVVAQILDYAKELTNWTYADLDYEVAKATKKGRSHMLALMKARFPGLDEQVFIDGINHSLRTGDMLLLIAGNGIRSGTEALVGFLEQYGSLRFSFGLVEIAGFQINDSLLLQPRVLAKTEVVRRQVTVVIGTDGKEIAQDSAEVIEENALTIAPELAELQAWNSQFWTQFLKQLKLDDSTQPHRQTPVIGTNFIFPMPPSGDYCWVSAYLVRGKGRIGVLLTWLKNYPLAAEVFKVLLQDKAKIEGDLGLQLSWDEKAPKFTVSHSISVGDLNQSVEREAAIAYLAVTVNGFVNAFRPRIKAALTEPDLADRLS